MSTIAKSQQILTKIVQLLTHKLMKKIFQKPDANANLAKKRLQVRKLSKSILIHNMQALGNIIVNSVSLKPIECTLTNSMLENIQTHLNIFVKNVRSNRIMGGILKDTVLGMKMLKKPSISML